MKKTLYNISNLKESMVSFSNGLPENLVVDLTTKEGIFAVNILLRLDDLQLQSLKEEGAKQKDLYTLFFARTTQKALSKKEPAVEIQEQEFDSFDFSKVVEIRFNGNTMPYLGSSHEPMINYIWAILVEEDEEEEQ